MDIITFIKENMPAGIVTILCPLGGPQFIPTMAQAIIKKKLFMPLKKGAALVKRHLLKNSTKLSQP